MKNQILAAILALASVIALASCATLTSPGTVTTTQQTVANAVEDVITVGLVPVLTKNASYVPAAQTVAATLGTFAGNTLTPTDVEAFLAKVPQITDSDRKTIAGIVNAAWSVYTKRYAQQVGANMRPDVKLFLAAVSNGIASACAAVPTPTTPTVYAL